jgi:hypothetical protein
MNNQAQAPAPEAPVQQPGQENAPPVVPHAPADPPAQPARAPPPPQQQAPAPAVPFAPRGRLRAPQAQGPIAPGLSTMLEVAAAAAWSTDESLGYSTFVPNFTMFAYVAHCCDNEISTTDRFLRAHPHWLPAITQLYISMLFYFRILDCMVASGFADDYHEHLLSQIKRAFDFRNLRVPGPLVPLFQAISVCNSGNDLLGDVVPVLPDIIAHTAANSFFELGNTTVPNVLALLDRLTALAHDATVRAATDDDYSFSSHTMSSLHSVNVDANNNGPISRVFSTPGFEFPQHLTPVDKRRFSLAATRRLGLPPRIDLSANASTTRLTWPQLLRFRPVPTEANDASFRTWFGNVATLMFDYSTFFAHSQSLASIPTASGAAPHVQGTYAASTATHHRPDSLATYVAAVAAGTNRAAVAAHVTLPILTSLQFSAHIKTPNIPDAYIQLGVLSQINVRRNAVHSDRARTGPVWDMSPNRQTMTDFDPFTNIAVYVASYNLEVSTARV